LMISMARPWVGVPLLRQAQTAGALQNGLRTKEVVGQGATGSGRTPLPPLPVGNPPFPTEGWERKDAVGGIPPTLSTRRGVLANWPNRHCHTMPNKDTTARAGPCIPIPVKKPTESIENEGGGIGRGGCCWQRLQGGRRGVNPTIKR